MALVTDLSGLNKDSVQKILQDYYKDPGLNVTEVADKDYRVHRYVEIF